MITLAEQNRKEQKDRAVAALITLGVGALILLFLILYKIITPLPPFPESLAGGGGQEINFGIYNEGTGNVEGPGIGDATSVVAESKPTEAQPTSATQEDEFKNGEQVLESNESKPKIKENTTVITPVKPKEPKKEDDKSTSNLLNAYSQSKSNTQSGGDGNSGHAGNEGSPDGNPNTDGKGGHGTGDGTGTGPGKGPGPGGMGVSLSGRQMLVAPPKVSDSKEEGIVVVIITVDKEGNVIDADANGKGTNTTSATLKSKARQAAKLAKFSPSTQYETQKGTIVFKFQF